jgi:hypothetical protein
MVCMRLLGAGLPHRTALRRRGEPHPRTGGRRYHLRRARVDGAAAGRRTRRATEGSRLGRHLLQSDSRLPIPARGQGDAQEPGGGAGHRRRCAGGHVWQRAAARRGRCGHDGPPVLVPGGQAVRAVRRHGLHEGRVRVSPRRRYVRRVDRLVPNRQAHQVGDCRRSPVLTASKRRSDNHLLRRHGRQAASSVWRPPGLLFPPRRPYLLGGLSLATLVAGAVLFAVLHTTTWAHCGHRPRTLG